MTNTTATCPICHHPGKPIKAFSPGWYECQHCRMRFRKAVKPT